MHFSVLSVLLAVVAAQAPVGKWFDRIVIMQFENHSEKEVLNDPNFASYSKMGRALMNYFAVTHPSQPNYWSQVAGSYFGFNDDSNHDLPDRSIFDIFEENGVSYKGYNEAYPGRCNPASSVGTYWRKHNPLISFNNVRNNATRCAKIVDEKEFDKDLDGGTLPQWSYYTPDINNDAHNTDITYAGKYLKAWMTARLSKFPAKTLIVLSWDEDDYTEKNQIYVSLLNPTADIFAAGSVDNRPYNHYSLLATVEANWNLPNLDREDATASVFVFKGTGGNGK